MSGNWKEPGLRVRIENERLTFSCLRCRQNLRSGDFTSLLSRVPEKTCVKMRAARAINHITHGFVSFSLP